MPNGPLYDLPDVVADPQPQLLPVAPQQYDYVSPDTGRPRVVIQAQPDITQNGDVNNSNVNNGPTLVAVDHDPFATVKKIGNKLLGINGEERYQLWPEKLIRSGITAAGDALSGQILQYQVDPTTGDVHTSPQMIERALDMSSVAGTGGLAGADATLGSTPFLRPALKYEGKIYKAPMGGQHLDALPPELADIFQKQAMSGEDISNFNFGFMNHKGQFLDREKALDYGIKEGLIDPHAGQYGALTSTLLADSSKPGVAIESLAKAKPMESIIAKNNNVQMTGDTEVLKNPTQKDLRSLARESGSIRTFTDKDGNLYAWDANKGTHEGIANSLNIPVDNWGSEWHANKGKLYTSGNNFKNYPSWLKDGMLLADSSKPGTAIEAMAKTQAPTFYSALEHNVNQIQQPKMTGDQWLGTLSNKPGVKPEELQWTGLGDFLKENAGKPVTKEQVQEHLANNKVELKEVQKGVQKFNSLPPQSQARVLDMKAGTHNVHYIDIPQSLKNVVMQKGQPLFSAGVPIPLMPVDHDPFKKKKSK